MEFFKIKSSLNIDLKIYLSRSLKDRLKRLELHRIQTSLDPSIAQERVYTHVRIWFAKAASEAVTLGSRHPATALREVGTPPRLSRKQVGSLNPSGLDIKLLKVRSTRKKAAWVQRLQKNIYIYIYTIKISNFV